MPSSEPRSSIRIIGELSCVGCGYRLTGLGLEDGCPECGVRVERSLRTGIDLGSLQGRPLGSARTIATSVTLLAIGFCLTLLTRPFVAFTITLRPFDTGTPLFASEVMPLRIAIGSTALVGLLGVAMMAISRRVIARVSSERPLTPRRRAIVIWAVAGLVLIDLLLLGSCFMPMSWLIEQGRTPRLSWTIATLLILRTAGHGTLLVLLCSALTHIGWRSERYRRAGNALQAAGPMLATLSVESMTLAAWMLRGTFGSLLTSDTSSGPFLGVWLIFSTLVAVGGLYLLTNTIWIVRPLFRARNRIDEMVGTMPERSTASMADRDDRNRSP